MKTTKFLVVVGDSECAMDSLSRRLDKSVFDSILYNEEARFAVIECVHPDFFDNVVSLQDDTEERDSTIDFVRDVDGTLWYVDDWMTKEECANRFE